MAHNKEHGQDASGVGFGQKIGQTIGIIGERILRQTQGPYSPHNDRNDNTAEHDPPTLSLLMTGIALILIFSGCIFIASGCCSRRPVEQARTAERSAGRTETAGNETTETKMTRKERKAYVASALKKEIFKVEERGEDDMESIDLSDGASASGASTCSATLSYGDADETRQQCAICLDNFVAGDEICSSPSSNCTHEFHYYCILKWLTKHDECPYCRRNFLDADVAEDVEGQCGAAAAATTPDSSGELTIRNTASGEQT